MRLEITRLYQIPIDNPKQTIGDAVVINDNQEVIKNFQVLELPWLDNEVRKSCIPPGTYKCVKRWSKKYAQHWHVKDVQGRTLILIHAGNFYTHTLGCILVGVLAGDINGDGLEDISQSVKTMNWLRSNMPDEFDLVVTWRS